MAYCIVSDVEMLFGETNVDKWADLDNDEDALKIAARIEWAIEEADNRIDTRMRGALYTIPFADPAPRTIETLSARLAGIALYDGRGITDQEMDDRMAAHRKLVETTFGELISGKIRLDLTPTTGLYPRNVTLG